MVPAGLKAGSDLPYCLPPNLSSLPVSVHTQSLSLHKIQFSPILFFLFVYFIISFYNFVSLTLFIVSVRLTFHVSEPTPNPYISFLEGNKGELVSCLEAQSKPQNGLLRSQRSTYPRCV